MSDTPILVISDTHFGFEHRSQDSFQHFMEYVTSWVQERTKKIEETDETLDAPQKIIILGDFIDLWVSKDSNSLRPYQESFNIVNSLIALGCEIVYVVGNHDDIVRRFYVGQHILPNWAQVYGDRYPDAKIDGKWQGRIGNKTYLFLHGHQFSFFRNQSVLRLGDFVGSAAAASLGFWKFKWLGALVFLLTLAIVASAFFPNSLFTVLSDLTASLSTQLGVGWTLIGGLILGFLASLGVLWLFGSLMIVYSDLYRHPGHTLNRYLKLRIPWQTIYKVIRSRGFKREELTIDADVVVFGHTHYPEMYTPKNRRIERLINTGSWIEQIAPNDNYDTFVYIDENRGRLYKWCGGDVQELQRWSNR